MTTANEQGAAATIPLPMTAREALDAANDATWRCLG
jgi:hypothetical protein